MTAWLFVLIAIAANIWLNYSLKTLSFAVAHLPLLKALVRALSVPAFWVAGISGTMLLGCFMVAIRSLPLSVSYASITGGSVVGLAFVGYITQVEQLSSLRLAGLGGVVLGIALMSQS